VDHGLSAGEGDTSHVAGGRLGRVSAPAAATAGPDRRQSGTAATWHAAHSSSRTCPTTPGTTRGFFSRCGMQPAPGTGVADVPFLGMTTNPPCGRPRFISGPAFGCPPPVASLPPSHRLLRPSGRSGLAVVLVAVATVAAGRRQFRTAAGTQRHCASNG
jgi:hypothetical protein